MSTPVQEMQGHCRPLLGQAPHSFPSDPASEGTSNPSLAVSEGADNPALFTVDGDQLMHARSRANSPHASCVVAPEDLTMCKHRAGLEVVLRSDQFKDVREADQWAITKADQLEALLPDTEACKRAVTSLTCLISVPLCDTNGLWHRMRFSECTVLASNCPQLFDGDPDAKPADVRINSSSIIVHNYVAAPEHECAVRPEETAKLESYNVPGGAKEGNDDNSKHSTLSSDIIIGAIAAAAGVVIGAVGAATALRRRNTVPDRAQIHEVTNPAMREFAIA